MANRQRLVKEDLHIPYSDHANQVHTNNIDMVHRELYLTGESTEDHIEPGVEFMMASRFIKNIRILDLLSNEPILIHMKTCGGDWAEGMAIYDAISNCKSWVSILSYTHARSMSSLIFQSADFRVMMPNSYFMYHWGCEGIEDRVEAFRTTYKFNRTADDKMLELYARRMKENGTFKNKPIKKIKEYLKEQMKEHTDVYLTPNQTIKLGLADEIFDGDWKKLKGEY